MDNQTSRDENRAENKNSGSATEGGSKRDDDRQTSSASGNQDRNQNQGGSGSSGGMADQARSVAQQAGEQVRSVAGSLTEQARSVASGTGQTATDLARRARDGVAGAGGSLYQQGSQAGQYIARGIDDYPIVALLVAGAVGYGLAYLIHNRWE